MNPWVSTTSPRRSFAIGCHSFGRCDGCTLQQNLGVIHLAEPIVCPFSAKTRCMTILCPEYPYAHYLPRSVSPTPSLAISGHTFSLPSTCQGAPACPPPCPDLDLQNPQIPLFSHFNGMQTKYPGNRTAASMCVQIWTEQHNMFHSSIGPLTTAMRYDPQYVPHFCLTYERIFFSVKDTGTIHMSTGVDLRKSTYP